MSVDIVPLGELLGSIESQIAMMTMKWVTNDAALPLITEIGTRPIAWSDQGVIQAQTFADQVAGVMDQLPDRQYVFNFCEDRYRFLVSFAACAMRGQVTLLPASRARNVIAELRTVYPSHYILIDRDLDVGPVDVWRLPEILPESRQASLDVPAANVVAIGFTSGSTGAPTACPKTWQMLCRCATQNWAALGRLTGANLVATVPAQHMYGMELSVIMPLVAPVAVHQSRPFYPEDIVQALAAIPEPRILITTPLHLRVWCQAQVPLSLPLAAIVSATAPLPTALACQAETQFNTTVWEMYGSTETCVCAVRRPSQETLWTPLDGVSLTPGEDGTVISARHLEQPVIIPDLIKPHVDGRFQLMGRRTDMVNVAGKRASLADLCRRLLAVDGVQDGLYLQLPPRQGQTIGRMAAIVVAPTVTSEQILQALRLDMDPVFLPRRIIQVAQIPRNEVGKVPQHLWMSLLSDSRE